VDYFNSLSEAKDASMQICVCYLINAGKLLQLTERINMSSDSGQNFLEKFGLEVGEGEVVVGQTYPIYGMITKFLDETPGQVVVELNYSIQAKMSIPTAEKVELLRERSFEPGIFISTVKSKDGGVVVDCSTVVFGKRQNHDA
jgi:hypothetical protein